MPAFLVIVPLAYI